MSNSTAMEHIRQPTGSSLCGQYVVAMLTGAALSDVIAFMGQGRSYPRDVRRGAAHFGVSLPSRSKPGTVQAPYGRGAALIWGEKHQHWVAWDETVWLDPAAERLLDSIDHYKPQAVGLYPIEVPNV